MTISDKPLTGWEDVKDAVFRAGDLAECVATGQPLAEVVQQSILASTFTRAVYVDEKLAAVWGYGPTRFLGPTAIAWLLTTAVVEQNPVRFLRSSRRIVNYMLEQYETVVIAVDARYTVAVRWLQWLGFFSFGETSGTFVFMMIERG